MTSCRLEMLPDTKWQSHYEQTFELSKLSAECEYLGDTSSFITEFSQKNPRNFTENSRRGSGQSRGDVSRTIGPLQEQIRQSYSIFYQSWADGIPTEVRRFIFSKFHWTFYKLTRNKSKYIHHDISF